jgi:serine/threonine-protein kinase
VLEVVELDAHLPAMVMEFLVGEDLNRVLDDEGPLSIPEATLAVHQACDAIAEAHGCGIVHRDLKPANLFRTRAEDGSLHIKVIDFGVAKESVAGEDSLTGNGTAMGSPMYMAPEQLRGERVDPRADVWALGVTLYELLAGITPFEASVPAMALAAILTQPPHPLREERDDVSEELERVILRCLEKEPARRYGSAIALREALEDHLTR